MSDATIDAAAAFAHRTRAPRDILPALIVWSAAILVSAVFFWILGDLVVHGISRLSWTFLVSDPLRAGRDGGIGPILVSTTLILLVCLAVSVPVGVGTAVLLAEFTTNRTVFGRLVRRSLDVLAGVPSIVFGLFGNAFFCSTLRMGFSILSGGLTLACMVLPILIRATEEGFRSVPNEIRLSSAALGISRASRGLSRFDRRARARDRARARRNGGADLHQRVRRPHAQLDYGLRTVSLDPHL